MEAEIVMHETGVDREPPKSWSQIALRSRNLKGHGLDEGISTRLLVYAGALTQARASARGRLPHRWCGR